MHQRLWLIAMLLLASVAWSAPAAAARPRQQPTSRPAPRMLAEARRILRNARTSAYSHKTRIDESAGIYEFDCSGFVCAALKKTSPRHLAAVPGPGGRRHPRAAEFHDAFAQAPAKASPGSWRRIGRLVDAQSGDLIAWRREKLEPGQSTGHIVIVDSAPIDEGNGIVRVTVIDSTTRPHTDDTRKSGATGIGRGTIWFKVDSSGRPIAYHGKSPRGPFRKTMIAIGRAE